MDSRRGEIEWDKALSACREFLVDKGISGEGGRFLLAVSGGIDSMCMLMLLREIYRDVSVAHMNYGLRGQASEADAEFVRSTCAQLGIPFFEKQIDLGAQLNEEHSGLQEKARDLRYSWFAELISEFKFDYLCTAHHLDDSVETALINMIRGTGMKGFIGIPFQRDIIIRPMLCFTRADIQEIVAQKQIRYREDASNKQDAYLRNRIRQRLIPLFNEERANFSEVMRRNQARLSGEHALLQAYLEELKARICLSDRGVLRIDSVALAETRAPDIVLYSFLRELGFTLAQCSVIPPHGGPSGNKYLSNTHEVVLHHAYIEVFPKQHFNQEEHQIQLPGTTFLPDGVMSIMDVEAPAITSDKQIEFIDGARLGEIISVRHWIPGDLFYPFGGKGSQKLQDFFTNEKLTAAERARAWVLLSDGEIVWICGMRLDDRFKITSSTRTYRRLSWTPHD